MSWSDWISDPVGSFTDTVGKVADTAGDVVSGGLNAVGDLAQGAGNVVNDTLQGAGDIVSNVGSGLGNVVSGINLSDPATLAALGAAAYGYYDPSMLAGGTAAGDAALGAGEDFSLANMASSAAPITDTATGAAEFGQASNLVPEVAPALNETAAETARLAAQNASASGVPAMTPTLGDMLSNAGSSALDWMGDNKLLTTRLAGGLYSMYAKNKMAQQQQAQYAQNRADVTGMYGAGSPELRMLQQEMARKDAAAGRNSQYGTRATDLAGIIAKYKTNALSNIQQNQNTLLNQAQTNRYGSLNSLFNTAALAAGGKANG